jgi:hypothetical protein
MKTLDYKLISWTFFDLITLKISDYASQEDECRSALGELLLSPTEEESRDAKEQKVSKIIEICSYLSKFALYDYDFYCEHSVLVLAESILKTTL